MKHIILFLALCGTVGCSQANSLETQTVTVRSFDAYHNLFVAESDTREVKVFDVCGRIPPPIWAGERFDIVFYWNRSKIGTNNEMGCYEIVSATRSGGTQ